MQARMDVMARFDPTLQTLQSAMPCDEQPQYAS